MAIASPYMGNSEFGVGTPDGLLGAMPSLAIHKMIGSDPKGPIHLNLTDMLKATLAVPALAMYRSHVAGLAQR